MRRYYFVRFGLCFFQCFHECFQPVIMAWDAFVYETPHRLQASQMLIVWGQGELRCPVCQQVRYFVLWWLLFSVGLDVNPACCVVPLFISPC